MCRHPGTGCACDATSPTVLPSHNVAGALYAPTGSLAMHTSAINTWLVAFTPAPGSDPESLTAGYLDRVTSRAELERALARGAIDVTSDPIAWREYSAQLRPRLFEFS